MSCTPCAQRRQILAEAKKKEGLKGVVRAAPAVVRHMLHRPMTGTTSSRLPASDVSIYKRPFARKDAV